MMERNLDGIYFRVERNGKWESICFSDLTREEMTLVMEDRDTDWLKSLCIVLGETLYAIGEQLNVVGQALDE